MWMLCSVCFPLTPLVCVWTCVTWMICCEVDYSQCVCRCVECSSVMVQPSSCSQQQQIITLHDTLMGDKPAIYFACVYIVSCMHVQTRQWCLMHGIIGVCVSVCVGRVGPAKRKQQAVQLLINRHKQKEKDDQQAFPNTSVSYEQTHTHTCIIHYHLDWCALRGGKTHIDLLL